MAKHNEAGETGSAPKPARAKRNAVPLAERRGLSRHLSSSWTALLVQAPGGPGDADRLLDFMLETGWIGGVRRDAAADLFAGRIPRPLGSWGLVIQLAGHPWCYLVGDGLHYEWAQELAAKLDCRTALFSCSGVHGTLSAWAYEGEETLFEFECGGFLAAEGRSVVYLRKDAFPAVITGTRFDPDWLRQFKRGEDAQDALARELGIYLPVLIHRSADGQADVYGRDAVAFKPVDYTRIDLIVFGDAATLEPTPAAFALAAAIDAGDAVGLREALAQGADARYLPDTDDSPLDKALALGQGSLYDWRYQRISREQQLEVLAVLLEAGANPDPAGDEPAAHRVLSFGDHGDERTVIRQLRLLFEHGANGDPAAELGTDPTPWSGVLPRVAGRDQAAPRARSGSPID
ncbi:MAG: hypothetical protein K0Q72_3402 [Armatimonadetes bacterium]|nr:hypothetical protein [Armatimonadota bacterium]